jgi:hypothetical protein
VPLYKILELGVAQYGSRILELRRLGFVIKNRRDSQRESFFRLSQAPPPPIAAARPSESLFPDMAERHWDLG